MTAKQTLGTTHLVAMILPGESASKVATMKYANPYDPPLTPVGLQQADDAASFLNI